MKKSYIVFLSILLAVCVLSSCHQSTENFTTGDVSITETSNESLAEDLKETAQNDTGKYAYSSVVISSDGGHIQPIHCFLSTELYENGEVTLNGSGGGAKHVFSDPETKISDFPTLVASGEVTATSPENARLGNPRLHDVNYENYDGYSNLVWSELHLLPAGEYIVVFGEYGDTRNTSEETETYWLLSYENVFRLIVPEK